MSWAADEPVVICVPYKNIVSRGIFIGDNPLYFSAPVLMIQIFLCSFFTGAFDSLLRPFGFSSFFSQMLGSMVLGPSGIMAPISPYVFSHQSLYIFETISNFACMFFLFLIGLKMDFSMITKSGRKGLIIGFFSFFVPFIMTIPLALYMKARHVGDKKFARMLPTVVFNECEVSFHVIACLLADLKLLNSEMGRLAMTSSVVSNTICFVIVVLFTTGGESFKAKSLNLFMFRIGSIIFMILVVIFLLKPIMLWTIKQTPEGSHVKQVYVFNIFVMVLVSAFFGQATGQPILVGPILLGMAVPAGPPLATTIDEKLESIIQYVWMPLFYVATAGRIQLSIFSLAKFSTIELFVLLAFLGKLLGVMIPSLMCDLPLQDAFALGLIMGTQGIMDVIHYRRLLLLNIVDNEVYGIMTFSAVLLAGITSLMVRFIYQPSRRYKTHKRSIGTSLEHPEFRILACVHGEFNAQSMINILQASNSSPTSCIHLYLLHLIQLQRVTTPILIAHQKHNNQYSSIHYVRSKRVINAFKILEKRNKKVFSVSAYTSMCPYGTMHDDICMLATDKRTSLIILPFHRQLNLDGLFITTNPIRNINRNVLSMAPCTVGILVDRGDHTRAAPSCVMKSLYSVAILFLGGPDDREVLSYGMRMAEYAKTSLTVIRFCTDEKNTLVTNDKQIDDGLINQFRLKFDGVKRVQYREEVVSDGVEIARSVRTMDSRYDLIMVGRQHWRESPLVKGLTEWNEYPELGFVGDMLATLNLDYPVSILVLQQQFFVSSDFIHSPSVILAV